jgi:hypothetical protein
MMSIIASASKMPCPCNVLSAADPSSVCRICDQCQLEFQYTGGPGFEPVLHQFDDTQLMLDQLVAWIKCFYGPNGPLDCMASPAKFADGRIRSVYADVPQMREHVYLFVFPSHTFAVKWAG